MMDISDLTSDHCGQIASFTNTLCNKPHEIECRPFTSSRCIRFKNNIESKIKPSIMEFQKSKSNIRSSIPCCQQGISNNF